MNFLKFRQLDYNITLNALFSNIEDVKSKDENKAAEDGLRQKNVVSNAIKQFLPYFRSISTQRVKK